MMALPIFAFICFVLAFFGMSDRSPLLGQTSWICFAIFFSATCIVESIRRHGAALLRLAERMERHQVLSDVAAQKHASLKEAVTPKPTASKASAPEPTAIEPSFDFLHQTPAGRSGQRANRS